MDGIHQKVKSERILGSSATTPRYELIEQGEHHNVEEKRLKHSTYKYK